MIIFPAIDIKDGRCVRLRQGRAKEETVYFDNSVEVASFWESQGAQYLHLVDLDGAFAGEPKNLSLIQEIAKKVKIPLQLGGGIRNIEIASYYFEAGVTRLIIGTLALENPEEFARLTAKFPGKIGVSLDAEKGTLKSRGWVKDTGLKVEQVIPELIEQGASFLVYTDILRDGMQSGANISALKKVLQISSIPVLVAGGIHNLEDIKKLYPLSKEGLEGVITGRAIYEKTLDLKEALSWLEQQKIS